jgi:sulfite exporter TauE/SafE
MFTFFLSISGDSCEPSMSLVPNIPNPYLAALVGGIFYGFAVCTSSCLPYITGYIAGVGAGFRKGVAITMIFNSGRIVAYALIGTAIGVFKLLVSDEFLTSFQVYSSFGFAIVTVVLGASILLKSKSQKCNYSDTHKDTKSLGRRYGFDVGAFSLGLSRGLLICAPLIAILIYSIPFATPLDTLALAVLFGVGTAFSPMLLLGGTTGWLLNKAPLLRRWISAFGGVLLIVLGLFTLLEALKIIGG